MPEKIRCELSDMLRRGMVLMPVIACLVGIQVACAQEISISLDRAEYPVPFGGPMDFVNSGQPDGRSLFPVHEYALIGDNILDQEQSKYLKSEMEILIIITDPHFNTNPNELDTLSYDNDTNPIKISVVRGDSTVVLAYAGSTTERIGKVIVDGTDSISDAVYWGYLREEAADTSTFDLDLHIRFTDGPSSENCPSADTVAELENRFSRPPPAGERYCIMTGDVLKAEYTRGNTTVTDTAVFVLRDGSISTDQTEYIAGSNITVTLNEPDLNLNSLDDEKYTLDLVGWDSNSPSTSIGGRGNSTDSFDPRPLYFKETGLDTGIFETVIKMPSSIGGELLRLGNGIQLRYTDWGPAGSRYVGETSKDFSKEITIPDRGATITLDKETYTWTDIIKINITVPDQNSDPGAIEMIGDTSADPLKISSRGHEIGNYMLVETGADTGIFAGEITLAGFTRGDSWSSLVDEYGNEIITQSPSAGGPNGTGPTDGFLPAGNDDGITIMYEYFEDKHAVGSAVTKWNIGTVQWLDAGQASDGKGAIQVTDADMNLDPRQQDMVRLDVWSTSDARGTFITIQETGINTGIFEGMVEFASTESSSGKIKVSENDTVAIRYLDNTLPEPYTKLDGLHVIDVVCIDGSSYQSCDRTVPPSLRDKHKGTVEWSKSNYLPADTATITVKDADRDLDSTARDTIIVEIWSKADAGGIDITAKETGDSTGIFTESILFTTSGSSAGKVLKIDEKDTITAEYTDNDVPSNQILLDYVGITSTACVGVKCTGNSTDTPEKPRGASDDDDKDEKKRTDKKQSDNDEPEPPKIKQQVIKPADKEPEPPKAPAPSEPKAPEPKASEPPPARAPEPPASTSPQAQPKTPEPKQASAKQPTNTQKIDCGAGTVEINGICQVMRKSSTQGNPGFFDWFASLFDVFS